MSSPSSGPAAAPTLLVLAAGEGRRYGGTLKQLDPLGPGGSALLDYAVADAARAGFEAVVVVVRRELEAAMEAHLDRTVAGRIPVELVRQEVGDLPPGAPAAPGRRRLWGPTQALWSARARLRGPFVVASADNVYGGGAVAEVARALEGSRHRPHRWALAGYRLGDVLSPHGPVNRGLCRVASREEGVPLLLREVAELREVRRAKDGGGVVGRDPSGAQVRLAGDELVSTNLWGFTPSVLPVVARHLAAFVAARRHDPEAESVLPDLVAEALASGEAEVEVRPIRGPCFGVTHPEDRPEVVARLARLGGPWSPV